MGSASDWRSFEQILEWSRPLETIRLVSSVESFVFGLGEELTLAPDVLRVMTGLSIRPTPGAPPSFWPRPPHDDLRFTLLGAALEAVAVAWSVPPEELFAQVRAAEPHAVRDTVGTDGKGKDVHGWITAVLRRHSAHG